MIAHGETRADTPGARVALAGEGATTLRAGILDVSSQQTGAAVSDGGGASFAQGKAPYERWTEAHIAAAVELANRIGTGRASVPYNVSEQALRMALQRAGYRRGWVKR